MCFVDDEVLHPREVKAFLSQCRRRHQHGQGEKRSFRLVLLDSGCTDRARSDTELKRRRTHKARVEDGPRRKSPPV